MELDFKIKSFLLELTLKYIFTFYLPQTNLTVESGWEYRLNKIGHIDKFVEASNGYIWSVIPFSILICL